MTIVNKSNIDRQHDLEGLPRHLLLTTTAPTYQMRVSDTVIIAISSATAGLGIITLPSLAEAVGNFYYISAPTGNTGDDISVFEKETGSEHAGGNLNADDDNLIFFSDGTKWRVAYNGVA